MLRRERIGNLHRAIHRIHDDDCPVAIDRLARNLKSPPHGRRIGGVNMELNGFKNDKSIGPLDIEKEVHERRPRAFRFEGSKDRLVIRSGIPSANGGVFNQDIMLARDFFYLVEESGRFDGTLQGGLMLLEPFIAASPEILLFDISALFGPGGFAERQFSPDIARHAEELAPDEKIDEKKDRPRHD